MYKIKKATKNNDSFNIFKSFEIIKDKKNILNTYIIVSAH